MALASDTAICGLSEKFEYLFKKTEQAGAVFAVDKQWLIDRSRAFPAYGGLSHAGPTPGRMRHSLGSAYVRDQLSFRTRHVADRPLVHGNPYILYWMQTTQRFEDNWALRFAILEADRINRPLLIVHTVDAHSAYAARRFHAFVLQGARELAVRAQSLGLTYRLLLASPAADNDRRVVALAQRAACIVTDDYPTDGVPARTVKIAALVSCRLTAVDSVGAVAASCFERAEYSARTLRPKLQSVLAVSTEPVEDRPPKRLFAAGQLAEVSFTGMDVSDAEFDALVEECGGATDPGPVEMRGGLAPARARLQHFVATGLSDYARRRTNPSDIDGTSRLSAHVRYGMISPLEIMQTARDAAPQAEYETFADEMLTNRALAHNLCVRTTSYETLESAPAWAQRTMAEHAGDPRPGYCTLDMLERAESDDPLWNAGQRELVVTGTMHPLMRRLWGKAVVAWAPTYRDGFEWLLFLNNKYSLDARDPGSYAGALWCFGKFDRPFAARKVWGSIRPMSLTRARTKHDVEDYLARWNESGVLVGG